MQTIDAALQTEFEKGTSTPEKVFNYKGSDKSSYVGAYGNVTRNADSICSGNVTLQIINTDKSWNDILANPQNHISPGVAFSTLQIGYTAIGFLTLFTGQLDSVDFSDVDGVGLSFRDNISYFTQVKVGSTQSPVDYYSSTSYTVFTNSNWSAGRNPADIIWHLLTYWGGLDSTESAANIHIDWAKFSEFKILLGAMGYLVQAKFQGETLSDALKEIADLTLSTIFSESDGKIVCRFWLGSDTASIQTYTSAKWKELPAVNVDRTQIRNRYEVFYGYAFPQLDTSTAISATATTISRFQVTGTAIATTNGSQITVTETPYVINEHVGRWVHILTGTGKGAYGVITANTTSVLTVNTSPAAGIDATFEIVNTDTWTSNVFAKKYIHITAGTGIGQTRMIASNDGATLTINSAWTVVPVATDTFEILDYDNGTFAGSYVNENATSKTNYGTFIKIIDSTNVWFKDSASADGFGQKALIDTKDPIQYVNFTSELYAYRQQLWDALYLTETFYSWSNQGFRIEKLSFQTDEDEITIEGRLSTLYNYLILDHATFGKLDYGNMLA